MRRFASCSIPLVKPRLAAVATALLLASCGFNGTDPDEAGRQAADAQTAESSSDPDFARWEEVELPDAEPRPQMQLQVVLDQQGFAPGVIDGKEGLLTANALKGFQEANELNVTGELDEVTRQALARWRDVPATRVVRIPDSWGQIQFAAIPEEPADQAELEQLGYETLDEKLAERFHTTVEVLHALNPGGRPASAETASSDNQANVVEGVPAYPPRTRVTPTPQPGDEDGTTATAANFRPGQLIRVPNVGFDIQHAAVATGEDAAWHRTLASLGVAADQPKAARVVVDESESWLKAYDGQGKLIAMFTVTTGSEHDPLPLGEWGINAVAHNPPFTYNPELFWDVPNSEDKQQLPPGPNGPVGVVWIDLTKEHYGIHGTPEPQNIGRTQSHGCVRLANWDAARLAGMVDSSTQVLFQA